MNIIDLSVGIQDGMIRYPSPYLPDVSISPGATHETHARSAQVLKFGTHVSTHIDAPFHAVPEGMTVEQIPLEWMCGRARIARFYGRDKTSPIDVGDLQTVADIDTCERLILDTDWARRTWGTSDYFKEGPTVTADAARYLASLPNLHLLGMDFANVDRSEDTVMGVAAPVHNILLRKPLVLLENLVRLSELPEEFALFNLPIALKGGDGCPCRPVGVFPLSDIPAWLGEG